jgi:hypothetical protein
MKTFEYHQFLKYIYFEGYADSYEGAENLIEELDNEEIDDLYEKFVSAMDTRKRGPDHRTTFPRFRNRGDEFDPEFTRRRVRRKQDGENVDPYYKGRKNRKEIRRTGVGGRSFTNGSDDEDVNEDLEIHNIIIDYLLDEGYTDTLESAEIIIENMSEQWLYDILMEKPFQIYGPDPHGSSDSELRPLGKPYKNKKRARTRADKLDQEIGGYRHIVRRVPEN